MTENILVADAITGRANLISTCPPPFVTAGTPHRFHTTATIQFDNEASTPVLVDITLKLVRTDHELARHEETFEVPPGGPTLHTVNWAPAHTLISGDKTIMVRLTVWKREENQGQIVSTWHVCEFAVE